MVSSCSHCVGSSVNRVPEDNVLPLIINLWRWCCFKRCFPTSSYCFPRSSNMMSCHLTKVSWCLWSVLKRKVSTNSVSYYSLFAICSLISAFSHISHNSFEPHCISSRVYNRANCIVYKKHLFMLSWSLEPELYFELCLWTQDTAEYNLRSCQGLMWSV